MLLQVFYIGVALQEPQQFIDDAFQVQLLGGQERKTVCKVVAALCTKDADGACACAVTLLGTLLQDTVKYV